MTKLTDLPTEMKVKLMSYLSQGEIVQGISLVNRDFLQVGKGEIHSVEIAQDNGLSKGVTIKVGNLVSKNQVLNGDTFQRFPRVQHLEIQSFDKIGNAMNRMFSICYRLSTLILKDVDCGGSILIPPDCLKVLRLFRVKNAKNHCFTRFT